MFCQGNCPSLIVSLFWAKMTFSCVFEFLFKFGMMGSFVFFFVSFGIPSSSASTIVIAGRAWSLFQFLLFFAFRLVLTKPSLIVALISRHSVSSGYYPWFYGHFRHCLSYVLPLTKLGDPLKKNTAGVCLLKVVCVFCFVRASVIGSQLSNIGIVLVPGLIGVKFLVAWCETSFSNCGFVLLKRFSLVGPWCVLSSFDCGVCGCNSGTIRDDCYVCGALLVLGLCGCFFIYIYWLGGLRFHRPPVARSERSIFSAYWICLCCPSNISTCSGIWLSSCPLGCPWKMLGPCFGVCQ